MFKEERIIMLKVLAILIAVFAMIASITGIVYPDIYKPIVLFKAMSFIFIQDLISLIAAVLLLILTLAGKKENIKIGIFQTAIIGYMFYAYGMYVLGTLYNYFYISYQAIFSLSIFYFINAFTGIEYEKLDFGMLKSLRLIIAVFCAVTPVVFAPQWISLILQWAHNGLRPSGGNFNFFVSLPILDLCFIIPVFILSSIFLFQKKILGVILSGILLIKFITLFLAVSLGYLLQPLFQNDTKMDVFNALLYSIIAFACIVLGTFYFINMKVVKTDS